MKTHLIFKLPEDAEELKWAQHGFKYHSAIKTISDDLRRIEKYEGDKFPEDFMKGIEYARNKLWECVRDHEIDGDF